MRKKFILAGVILFLIILIFTNSWPSRQRSLNCDSSMFRKLDESGTKICIKVDDKFEFVERFSREDGYEVVDFCLKFFAAAANGRRINCWQTEYYAKFFRDYNYPRDLCVDYLRDRVFEIERLLSDAQLDRYEIDETIEVWEEKNSIQGCYEPSE